MNSQLTIKEKNHFEYALMALKRILGANNYMDLIKKNSPNFKYMAHVILHRRAVAQLETQTGHDRLFAKEHDLDKVGLGLVLGKDIAKPMHKKITPHHGDILTMSKPLLIEKACDDEACHKTKLGITKNAYEYLITEGSEDQQKVLLPIIDKLGFSHENTDKPVTQEYFEHLVSTIDDQTIYTEVFHSYQYLLKIKNGL